MERRLAAILAADIVGYSRLMGEDEEGTLARLESLKTDILDPLIAQHRGRVVKLMGDGFILEFASVVNALACALEWQDMVEDQADRDPKEHTLRFRIGVNLGDVMVNDDDLYGDGVNVAARLEALAAPGSILVSRTVYDHANGKLAAKFEDFGEKQLKNIAKPVQVYRATKAAETARGRPGPLSGAKPKRHTVVASIAALFIAVAVGALWLQPWASLEQTASVEAMVFPLPDKPSIAVLPFDNLSDDGTQGYFADGMTEDLITDLSKIAGLFVIARHSTFAYKGRPVKIKDVAEELGVRFVLEGSVRRAGDTLRVNAQLIDATTGGHVWADRFDGDVADVFALQDEFVLKIVRALELELSEGERSEIEKIDTQTIEAREAFQRGWELYSRFNERDSSRAVKFFENAIELDPEYGRAYGALALTYQRDGIFRWNHDPNVPRNRVYVKFVQKHLDIAGQHQSALFHVVKAMRHLNYRGQNTGKAGIQRADSARVEAGYAIALQPSDPEAHITMAWALISGGKPQEGLNFVEAAKRLNPKFPSYYALFEAAAYFGLGDLSQASSVLKQSMARDSHAAELAPFAASINALLGNRQVARAIVESWKPGQDQEALQQTTANYFPPIQWAAGHHQLNERLFDGLRLAAAPAEVTVASLLAELPLQKPSEQVSTIRTLGWFGPTAAPAVPDLVEVLGEKNKRVRREAAITLGKIGTAAEAAIPALKAIVDEPIVGLHASKALIKIADG